jgi:hypothetical protein
MVIIFYVGLLCIPISVTTMKSKMKQNQSCVYFLETAVNICWLLCLDIEEVDNDSNTIVLE